MKFEEALAAMREGKTVVIESRRYAIKRGLLTWLDLNRVALIDARDLLDDRWQIVQEPKKYWINVYRTEEGIPVPGYLYESEEAARQYAEVDHKLFIKTIQFEA
jgi:hypothetical protein